MDIGPEGEKEAWTGGAKPSRRRFRNLRNSCARDGCYIVKICSRKKKPRNTPREGERTDFAVQIRCMLGCSFYTMPGAHLVLTPLALLLASSIPPINWQSHARDVGCILAGQKDGAPRNFLDCAPLAPRRGGDEGVARGDVFVDGDRHGRFEN